jgi:dolichol kinase
MAEVIEDLADVVLVVSFSSAMLSLFAIALRLHRARLYTLWQLRTVMFWPELLVRYRDYTRQTTGHTGVWYYLAIVGIVASLACILYAFASNVPRFFRSTR